jgi:hypothetical protein
MKVSTRVLRILTSWLILTASSQADDRASTPIDRALIIVGLPGDQAHEALFARTTKAWRDWLVGPLGFSPANVHILSATPNSPSAGAAQATRESINSEARSLLEASPAIGRLWVFVLGHANFDGTSSFLHLPGPDLRDDEFAALFQEVIAKEQIFWLTTPASGSFLRPLSKPGRIVVAATEPVGEVNETEFPHALADLVARPSASLDLDRDGKVSIVEIYRGTVAAVEARFQMDHRVPTEHAQLDDDGDGSGSELQSDPKGPKVDGALASRTYLPSPNSRSQNGQDRTKPSPR